ncbi:MAG: nuclear transport factor 2 family protein [Actinobacteria bacterium]|nr:nuclear transport factor 2 family protein [Actinomycetota bacterium]
MDARLQELSDKQEIRDLLLIYCRGVDRCELELVKAAFWEDAIDDHGPGGGPAWEFATHLIQSKLANTAWTTHAVSNHLVDVEGDLAFSEATVVTYQKPAEGGDVQVWCGRYVDRVERRGGTWKFAHRRMVHDWSGSLPLGRWGLASVATEELIQGARAAEDIVTGPGRARLMARDSRQ